MRSITLRPVHAWFALPVVFLGLFFWLLPMETTGIWWELRAHTLPYVLIPAFLIAAGAGIGYKFAKKDWHGSLATIWQPITGGIIGLLFAVPIWIFLPYARDAAYAESVKELPATEKTSDQVGVFDYRLPYDVARAQARTAVDGIPGAELTDNTRYVPSAEAGKDGTESGGKFFTLVTGRSALGEYAAVAEQTYTGGGRTTASQCAFADGAKSEVLGGWFNHNLGREISSKKRWVNWSNSDAYGYCKDGQPLVIVPLKAQKGFLATEVPYGAAIYNGFTGALVIERNPAKIPGGGYPLSLAAKQRESTSATGSWWGWIRGIVGYKTAENTGDELVLARTVDGKRSASYVTQLSFQGNTSSIVALSTVSASDWRSGELGTITVHRVKPQWQSAEAIVKRVENDYRDIPNWQNLQVHEIAPAAATQFNTTIGNEQNVAYAVRGTGNLGPLPAFTGKDAPATCLFLAPDFDNAHQCGTRALRDGNGIGIAYGRDGSNVQETGDDPVREPSGDSLPDLSTLSPAQLADLQRRLADEWLRRAPK